jgi:hypothetical protein
MQPNGTKIDSFSRNVRQHRRVAPRDRVPGDFQNPLPDRNSLRIVRAMIMMSMRNDHFSM